MEKSGKKQWIKSKINELKLTEKRIDKMVFEHLSPHLKNSGLNFDRVAYVEHENGKVYFIRNACLSKKVCVETENAPMWSENQKKKIEALRSHGFKVFFLLSCDFTKRGVAELTLNFVRHLSKTTYLKDGKLANKHSCLDCHRYDVNKEECRMFHHKVNIWDMACIHFNSEELIPKKEVEQPKPKKKARKKRRNGFFLPSAEPCIVQTIGFFVVKYNVPGSKLVKDVRVYHNPSMSMGTCSACANYVKAENKCRKLVEAAIKKEYSCSLYSPSSNQG